MSNHIQDLAKRRRALVAQAERQRASAAEAVAGIRMGLRVVDRGLAFFHAVERKPLVLGLTLAAVALVVSKPRQAVRWFGLGLTGYRMLQRVRRWAASPPRASAED